MHKRNLSLIILLALMLLAVLGLCACMTQQTPGSSGSEATTEDPGYGIGVWEDDTTGAVENTDDAVNPSTDPLSDEPTDPAQDTNTTDHGTTEPAETPDATTEPTEAAKPTNPQESTAATEPAEIPNATTEPTESTKPTQSTKPTEPEASTGTTEPEDAPDKTTEPTTGEQPTQPEEGFVAGSLNYEQYMALSTEQQKAYALSFPSVMDYINWFNAEKEAYGNKEVIEITGPVDLGGFAEK